MNGFLVIYEDLPNKVSQQSDTETLLLTQTLPNHVVPYASQSRSLKVYENTNPSVENDIITKIDKHITVHQTYLPSIRVTQNSRTETIRRVKTPNLTVSKSTQRSWVVSSGPITIQTGIQQGMLYVDPLTSVVFIFIRAELGGFDLVEVGYYANICRNITFTSSPTEPPSPQFGDLWLKTDTGEYFTAVTDSNENYTWAELSATGGKCTNDRVAVSEIPPGSPSDGSLWFDLNSGSLMVYTTDGDSSQWVDVTE